MQGMLYLLLSALSCSGLSGLGDTFFFWFSFGGILGYQCLPEAYDNISINK